MENVNISYNSSEKVLSAQAIDRDNIVVSVLDEKGNSRLEIKDENGNTKRTLLNLGNAKCSFCMDKRSIIAYSYDSKYTKKYIINLNDYSIRSMQNICSNISKVVSCGEMIYEYDSNNKCINEVTNYGLKFNTTEVGDIDYMTSNEDGVFYTNNNYSVSEDYLNENIKKYGKCFKDSIGTYSACALAPNTGVNLIASKNMIFVSNNNNPEGFIYLPNFEIKSLSFDYNSESIIVISTNIYDESDNVTLIPFENVDNMMGLSQTIFNELKENNVSEDEFKKISLNCNGNLENINNSILNYKVISNGMKNSKVRKRRK